MFSLNRPLGRIPFVIGTSFVDSVLLLATLLAFAFMPSGNGHIGVLIIMAALMGWWFSLHARRFATSGYGFGWPLVVASAGFLTFAMAYGVNAALWSVPDVQQEAFRTGGTDFTRHVETSAALLGLGRWFAAWIGVAGALVLSGFMAILMGLVAFLSGVFSFVALVLPTRVVNVSSLASTAHPSR
jgi:hypothetical protein